MSSEKNGYFPYSKPNKMINPDRRKNTKSCLHYIIYCHQLVNLAASICLNVCSHQEFCLLMLSLTITNQNGHMWPLHLRHRNSQKMSLDVVYTKGFASGMLSLNITKASSQVKIATGNARSSDKTEDSPNMSLCANSTNCNTRKLRKMHPLNS